MNLSLTPCTNLESYILRLHCTSRKRDLKEKEREMVSVGSDGLLFIGIILIFRLFQF